MNLGTAEETVFASEGGTSSSAALVGELSDGVLSTILGRRGALRRLEVSFATRMGAGLGNVNEIGLGGGEDFFLEVEAQPENETKAVLIMEKTNVKRIA